jgi:hypothetical protein
MTEKSESKHIGSRLDWLDALFGGMIVVSPRSHFLRDR